MFKGFSQLICASAMFAAPAFALEVGDTAPCAAMDQFNPATGKTYNGCISQGVDGAEFAIVEFSQVNCGACRENMPGLSRLASETRGFATSRDVVLDRNKAAIDQYIERNKSLLMPLHVGYDLNRAGARGFGVTATPTIFVVDADGKILYKHVGVMSQGDISEIKSLVGAGQ